jgi:hypothetical protein
MVSISFKGHPTRYNELISILEMIGGKNIHNFKGDGDYYYFIDIDGNIEKVTYWSETFMIYTIDTFIDEFPYKIGDKVRLPEYESDVRIYYMRWSGFTILYGVYVDDDIEWYTTDELNEYNVAN